MASELDRKRALSRCVLCVATVGAAAVTMVACGGTSSNLGSVSHPTLPSGLQSTPSGAPGPTSGNLGDTLTMVDAGEDVAHVTLVKVFDPASGFDPNTTPPDGTRWVGFEGTIVIDGSRAGEDSTSVDVIGSDGQTYGADTSYHLSVFDGCTATGIDVASGQTQTFCAGVGLPPGVTVAKVGYSTEGVDGNVPAKLFWTVAGPGQNAPSASTPTATPTVSAAPANSSTGSVGDTLTYTDSAGTATQVTLVQIFDPAQGVDSGSSPPDGNFDGSASRARSPVRALPTMP